MPRTLNIRSLSKDEALSSHGSWGFKSDFTDGNNNSNGNNSSVKDNSTSKNSNSTYVAKPGVKCTRIPEEKGSSECWLTKYRPTGSAELAVHKKKVQDVSNAIADALSTSNLKVVILTGPPGSGKTATLQALSRDHDYDIEEWINPIQIYESGVFYENEISKFKSFLFSSSRYSSVIGGHSSKSKRKIVLVEDIPTFASRDQNLFWEIIKNYRSHAAANPLFIVISDGLPNVRVPLEYVNISFNPVAPTLMKRALERLSRQEKGVSGNDIDTVVSSANGDIRTAILNLQFYATSSLSSDGEKSRGKRRRVDKKKDNKESSNSKDKPLFIFHAIGKFLHAKRDPASKLDCDDPILGRRKLEFNPEDVVDQCVLSSDMLTQFLHHNYLNYHDDVTKVQIPADTFCTCDEITSYWISRDTNENMIEYSSSLSSRAVVYAKDPSFTPKFTPICKPVQRDTDTKAKELLRTCQEVFMKEHHGVNKSFITETLPFLKKLKYKGKTSREAALIYDISTFNINSKVGQSLNNKENYGAEEHLDTCDKVSRVDDPYLLESKELETEIADFSD